MNEGQIIELFVQAAEVDRKLPDTARPARLKAMNLGYVHTFSDIAGYGEDYRTRWLQEWLDPSNLRLSTNQLGVWEAAMEVMKLVQCPKQRRALWAWAKSEAGGKSFAKWCRTEGNGDGTGISRQLGDWRKRAAIDCIARAFASRTLQHNISGPEPDFTNHPEIRDKSDKIEVWRDDDMKPLQCYFDSGLSNLRMRELQKQQRRQRKAA